MPIDIHTIESPDGATPARTDRAVIGFLPGVANAAGSGAGAAVTVAVTGLVLPPSYSVVVNPGQDATWFVSQSSKTGAGFTVTLNPRLAANTLAAGAIDITILG